MSSGGSPYTVTVAVDENIFQPLDPTIIETTITADETTGVDLGLGGGLMANIETYNGSIPGPVFKLKVNDTVIVRLINLLDHPTGIHWHGIELANSADGTEVTQEPVLPAFTTPPPSPAPAGGSYLYKFKVTRPGLYWYHPHHHISINRVFRGLYGMIVVEDPNEATLIANEVIPDASNTLQLVLSDITVCKAPGTNDAATFVNPMTVLDPLDRAEWLSGANTQGAPSPIALCDIPATAVGGSATNDDHDGTAAAVAYGAGDVPSIVRPLGPAGKTNEGQTVLTNGMNVGHRPGKPFAPRPLVGGERYPVLAGQGLRLQIVNCATTRYFRLLLTTDTGVKVNLVRIGGEGGILNNAVVEGGLIPDLVSGLGDFDTKYESGEILLPPGSRADVVAKIPDTATGVLTMWTRDFERTGPGYSNIPSVPVMHLEVTGVAPTPFTELAHNDPLRASIPGASHAWLGTPDGAFLTPSGGFMIPKLGMTDPNIELSNLNPELGINGEAGTFEPTVPTPYSSAPHIDSTRYAEPEHTLQLTVTNSTSAHHPFHLHGFSFQPISLTQAGTPGFHWTQPEFRDNIDVPASYTLTFKVFLGARELVDGLTVGGALGRWLFHCHIFFHHHRGMISELVVTDVDGNEKPNVDVGGSWEYAPSGGLATRDGTYSFLDAAVVDIKANKGGVTPDFGTVTWGGGTWHWEYLSVGGGLDDGVSYVYVTATDADGKKDQTVFRLKIGAPDDGADNGDPHIHTVDGKYYDFQAVGEFTLLRNIDGLEIQVRQTPVPTATPITDPNSGLKTCVSINTAVAARIGAHRIAWQPVRLGEGQLQFYLDGKPATLTERGIDLDEGRIVAYAAGGATSLRVDYANHTVLTVTPWFWTSNNVWLLNITVSHTDADQGIMGRIPPKTWLPLLPNGASVGPKPAALHDRYITLYRTFADAWRVTDQSSLFVYAPGTSTKTFTDRAWPAEKPPCEKVKPEFQIPGANPPREGIPVDVAEQICRPVTIDDLHKGCVFDVATTGDKSLVENYLLAQELRLKGTAVQLVSDKPRIRPGESVTFTAIVSVLAGGRAVPTGTVTFLIDDVPTVKPVDLDDRGRATLKAANLGAGLRRIRAAFTAGGEQQYLNSSSPTLRLRVEQREAVDRGQAPYRLRGTFYEACDCFTVCPCWMGNNPDGGECTGVFAWEIEKGSIDGVDVSGLRVVSVSHHVGMRDEAKQRVVIFVDERASRQQTDALVAAFSGHLGGPLQELADLLGQLAGVEHAPIELRRDGRLTTLLVDHRIRIEGATSEGPSGRAMALNDGRLSNVLGTPAAIGQSGRFRIGLMAQGMEMDVRGRSTMSGRFSYVHTPGKAVAPAMRGHAG